MGFEDFVLWYQKKIGTYDKQQWEITIEERILRGLNDIKMKSAKLKTEFIDLDLIRGSSFTKAKPQHGFVTVARLATLRYLLLPLYSKWWSKQTSSQIFSLLFLLYILQFFNTSIYIHKTVTLSEESSEKVPFSEIVVPIIAMWTLSIIHTLIVSTNTESDRFSLQIKKSRNYRRKRLNTRSKGEKSYFTSNVDIKRDDIPVKSCKSRTGLHKLRDKSSENYKKTANSCNNTGNTKKASALDDDGFESLNGNGSSPSDNNENNLILDSNVTDLKFLPNERVQDLQDKQHNLKLNRRHNVKFSTSELDSDSDTYTPSLAHRGKIVLLPLHPTVESTCDTEDELDTVFSSDIVDRSSYPTIPAEFTTSREWIGVTTNSDDGSCSSDYDQSNIDSESNTHDICGFSDRVSCTIWERRQIKKAELSVFDISSVIIDRVESMPESMDYFYVGAFFSTIIALLPIACRFFTSIMGTVASNEEQLSLLNLSDFALDKLSGSAVQFFNFALGAATWEQMIMVVAAVERWVLAYLFFFLLAVAERTFKQRFLYAKLFSHLTSSRGARKSALPHFRLNKVRNIKTWLSVRSYLKKRGPQRSVDVIVSTAFIIALLLLSFLCIELLKDAVSLHSQYNLEALVWCLGLGILLLRFMTLGTKINRKYRNLSVLIMEQINLYLQIEQKPHKKDELIVANNVLKLAADLLKELESPFKISGLSANPYLYTVTKVVILSALSGVLSKILGFKLKLDKIIK